MDNKFFVVKLRSMDTDANERNYSALAIGENKADAVRKALTADCFNPSGAQLCSENFNPSGSESSATRVVEHDGREVMMKDCIEVCEPTFRFLSTFL